MFDITVQPNQSQDGSWSATARDTNGSVLAFVSECFDQLEAYEVAWIMIDGGELALPLDAPPYGSLH